MTDEDQTPTKDSPNTEHPTVSDVSEWTLVHDSDAKRDYYFNIHTQESRWDPPEGLEDGNFRRYEELQEAEQSPFDGWHYIDASGTTQGPFTEEQLKEWRAYFPMNTVFYTADQIQKNMEEKSSEKGCFLAEILGDNHYLQRWKLETMNSVSLGQRVAPTATEYELYLQYPANLIIKDPPEEKTAGQSSSEQGYADAVLAGLPPEDETVQLADLAKQSGMPLKEIMRFMEHAASDGTTRQLVTKDPYTGKMTAVAGDGNESQQLYAEFSSWIDPTKMEKGLKKSAQYRREKLPSLWMKQVGYKKRTLPWQDERYDRGDN